MIHQFIFAHPRPGMTEQAFQRYWLEVHAVQYAMKIPQIVRYRVNSRLALPGESGDPLWSGVAEIWLRNEREQLESLQSPEFLQGARLDEPNWAAFWRTLGVDTDAHIVAPPPTNDRGSTASSPGCKLLVLSKRKEGLPLGSFRERARGPHATLVTQLPGLRGYVQGYTRDGAYAIGEAAIDCIEQLWFDSLEAGLAAQRSGEHAGVDASYRQLSEARYIHQLWVQEHWIIGPEPRPVQKS